MHIRRPRPAFVRLLSTLLFSAGLMGGGAPSLSAQALPARSNAASAPLSYYFNEAERSFDPAIPTPEEFLGYEIGAHHTRHDRIVAYLEELARLSDRAVYRSLGESYERRPLPILTVTSPANHARLEEIRQTHLRASEDPSIPAGDRPVIVHLAYGVHGGETSGPEAALLTAYWLVAGTSPEVLRALEEGVYHVEPVQNPDGRERHTVWVNGNRSLQLSADPLDREHNEGFPGGRTNHYQYDLNRDWLPLENPENRVKVDFHHGWRANVVTDVHEMGTNATYYFEPSKPYGSWNPLIPQRLYTGITLDFAEHYRRHLDEIGSLYFTKEQFDNTYPGYGSTYPKFLGGFALTFEQASSRGGIQESTHHGVLTYAFSIRNQHRTGLATVRGALEHRQTLLEYQQEFFATALSEADAFPVKGYLWGDPHDATRNRLFLEFLLRHRLEVYELGSTVTQDGHAFEPGSAWVVPTRQPHYRLVRSIFETTDTYADSTFYDASTWTVSLAYGVPQAELRRASLPLGGRVTQPPAPPAATVPRSHYVYLLDWSDTNAPKALYWLQARGVRAEVATQPFTLATHQGPRAFVRGSISIPVQVQTLGGDELHALIQEAARESGVTFQSASTGYALAGVDLGSAAFRPILPPRILLVAGGEGSTLWHLLDTKVGVPLTRIEAGDFSRADLTRYTVIVVPSGGLPVEGEPLEELRRWVRRGGTLVAVRGGVTWAVGNGFTPNVVLQEADAPEEAVRRDWGDAGALASQAIGGSIWQADLDITHPLGFGYHRRELAVWRDHSIFLAPSRNSFSTVAQLTDDPHLSGYISPRNRERLRNSPSVVADRLGGGSVVLLADQPNHRGYWYGTNRLFLNALFFGALITTPGGG